ncbi:class I SAM-dependent methyltransferase [[Phormidium] sp. ETS-05]|uniref:class I SAM-dependent methyltransferase n=1 Tax=[Phormidium] sp. ETS-05 TaxID=222819 RepID=UPI0018EEE012|nr:class I SAM-dependent methyltransferase [[Phormidium] sp. ETS-05]
MADLLTQAAYTAFQLGKSNFALAHKNAANQVRKFINPSSQPPIQPLSPNILQLIQQKYQQLLETDWQDAQSGIYPPDLLFDNPWEDFLPTYAAIWQDMPQVWDRALQKNYQDFPPDIDTEGYPKYYLQNFHHQTDGYLSDKSAALYDLQVELLFNGMGDAMRRRVLAPLKQGLTEAFPPKPLRILDVASGTGRTLKFIRAALPQASLFGIDLSPAYLRKATRLLSEIPGELPQLVQGNAEEMPYRDNYFHGITSVFMFHELPAPVRMQVIAECFRVLQPGGVFVICDSIQVIDSPELQVMMENFSTMFHEPYYQNYINDNLVERLEKAGFEQITNQSHFVSKYWIARKPKSGADL